MRSLLLFTAALALGMLASCTTGPPLLPNADAGPDQTVTLGATVTLDGSGSSGLDLSFAWAFERKPEGSAAILAAPDSVTPSFVADAPGEYLLTLRVSNALGSDTDAVSVTAREAAEGALEPGRTHVSPSGVVLGALPGALEAPVEVAARKAEAPGIPLPARAAALGPFYRLSAAQDTFAAENPFVVALPVPDGADTASLALALLLEPQDVDDGELTSPVWQLLEGVYDPAHAYFLTTLPLLAADGRVVVLVSAKGFTSPSLSAAPKPSTQQTEGEFLVSCRTFDDDEVNNRGVSCSSSDEADLAAALEDAYADYTALGFVEPYLQRRIDEAASSFSPNNVNIVFGEYLAELRPLRDVGEDEDRWPCGSRGGITNLGGYRSGSQSFFVCIGEGGVTARARETARHEYFHATQYGYASVRRSNETWVKEATATASEGSLATMARDDGRPLHPVDVPLTAKDDDELYQYRAQDFFVYAGLTLNRGLAYLTRVFREGAATADVDRGLVDLGVGGGLSELYWAWAKNQAFEKATDLGGGVLGDVCTFNANAVEALGTLDYDGASADLSANYALDPLSAKVIRFDFGRTDGADYQATITIPRSSADLRVKFYDLADAGTPACQSALELPEQSVLVRAGETRTLYALVANTSLTQPSSAALSVTGEPRLTINQPSGTFREGEALTFQATLTGLADPAGPTIRWSYRDGAGSTRTIPTTSRSGESFTYGNLPCDDLLVRAEADTADGTIFDVAAVSCTPKEERYFLNITPGKSGQVYQDGRVILADGTSELRVGDDAGDVGVRTLLQFPLTLPDGISRITRATLSISVKAVEGDPHTALGDLRVYHADYGDTLEAGDFATTPLPGAATFPFDGTTTFGRLEVDLTTAVQDAYANRQARGNRVQVVLYFPVATDNDGAADAVVIEAQDRPGTYLLPALEIAFENY